MRVSEFPEKGKHAERTEHTYINRHNKLVLKPSEIPSAERIEWNDPRLMAMSPNESDQDDLVDARDDRLDALQNLAQRLTQKEAELDLREATLDGQKQAIVEILSKTVNHITTPHNKG